MSNEKDIVKKLREAALSGDLPLGKSFDCASIADEIERLRSENAEMRMLLVERKDHSQ